MNITLRTLGRIAGPAAVLTSVLLVQSSSFGQTTSKSAVSVAAGSDRLLRADSVTDIAAHTLLQVDGVLRVAGKSQATLKLSAGSLVQGVGSVKVESGSTLIIDSSEGQLGKVSINNQGTVVLKGLLDCAQGLDFQSSGTLVLDAPSIDGSNDFGISKASIKALYPNTGAVFTIRNGGILKGHGVLNGSVIVQPGGKIVLSSGETTSTKVASAILPARDSSGNIVVRKPAIPSPSPDFVTITGDVSMTTGALDVDFTSTSYGQMSVSGTAVLGGATLNCHMLGGYTPAYVDAFRIIRCDNITGQFNNFNTTALNFDNRGIIAITGGKAYRLSGY